MSQESITKALGLIFKAIEILKEAFPKRAFTIDGRLVGDVGEVIAALEYDVVLHDVSQPTHDANTSDGRNVQIKATFQDKLTFKTVPDYYLGFKLHEDGHYEEIFNGPGKVIFERYAHRKGIGVVSLRFPVSELRRLSEKVEKFSPDERIPKRES